MWLCMMMSVTDIFVLYYFQTCSEHEADLESMWFGAAAARDTRLTLVGGRDKLLLQLVSQLGC